MKKTELPIYNIDGKKIKKMELTPAIFNIDTKPILIQKAVTAQAANTRKNIAHTKGRAAVSGGGRKPWRQKGTGKARHGSIRSPIWKGGGVTFGPSKNQNFGKKINKKTKKQALKMAISEKAQEKSIKIIENLELKKIKTKLIFEILKKLKIDQKKILLVLDKKNDKVIKSAKNLPNVNLIAANSLNIIDVLKADIILTTVPAIKIIISTYGNN